MKAVIPLAGKGTRLRPHTHLLPKPLVRVAGRPVLAHLLDDLVRFGIREMVFIVGHLDDVIRRYMAEAYPNLRVDYVVQAVQDGTAGAVKLAQPFVGDELLILFADTLFEADLSPARALSPEWSAVIWTKEVEDYWKYGVVVTGSDGAMTRIVEKPEEPISRRANIGLYHIRDSALLFEGIDHVLASPTSSSGEYYLTDAFQYMVDRGARIRTAPVDSWHDCGSPEGLLGTNRHLLEAGPRDRIVHGAPHRLLARRTRAGGGGRGRRREHSRSQRHAGAGGARGGRPTRQYHRGRGRARGGRASGRVAGGRGRGRAGC